MKYALKFTPGRDTETTMWVWFQDHGAYYVTDRSGIVHEANTGFLDSSLEPGATGDVKRVSFDDVPEHVHGYDPRDIVDMLPTNYPNDTE